MTPDASHDSPVRPTRPWLVRVFFLFLIGLPALMWFTISPYVAKRLNHREWTQWARQDLRALAAAVEAYRAAEGAWPPTLANLTPVAAVRVSNPPKRRRFARPAPAPTPLPPDIAVRMFIPHLPVDPYAPGFDYPTGRTYQYVLYECSGKIVVAAEDSASHVQSAIRNPESAIAFIVLSPGPDYTIGLDLSAPPDAAALPAFAYDPTNGLISGGDIFVTGLIGK